MFVSGAGWAVLKVTLCSSLLLCWAPRSSWWELFPLCPQNSFSQAPLPALQQENFPLEISFVKPC